MKRGIPFLFAMVFFLYANAQEPVLPNYMSKEEAIELTQKEMPEAKNFNPIPPPYPVRTMGEWEEVRAIVVSWVSFKPILAQIIEHSLPECEVIVVAENPQSAEGQIAGYGVNTNDANLTIIQGALNSIWIRDYGPWTTYKEDVDSLTIADWEYNRHRPDDDVIPDLIADHYGYSIYNATVDPYRLVHSGGNHLQDGMYTAFASDLIFDENPYKTEEEIDEITAQFLGAHNFVKLPKLPFDIIHHLDMHMRFIDEETIIFAEYPEGVADGPQIEDNIRYIRTKLRTHFGNKYEIIRVPSPPEGNSYPDNGGDYRTYTNAIFVNKTILVPVYGHPDDATALAIYEENLPGYNVVPIDCDDMIFAAGALHCIAKLVGADDPLWIAHPRLRDTYDTVNDYEAMAIIKHASGISSASLYYRTNDGGSYQSVGMTLTNAEEDIWTAAIPAQMAGTEVQYYIHAMANSGKEQVRPLVAPNGYFRFNVKGLDIPKADFLYDLELSCPETPITFYDESEGVVEEYSWSFPGGEPATSNEPNPVVYYSDPGQYNATLTVSNSLGENSITKTAIITIDEGVEPFLEDFTGGPDPAWEVDNPQQDAAFWQYTASSNCQGGSFRMNNRNFDTKDTNDYLRGRFDLSGLEEVVLNFDVAYAEFNPFDTVVNKDALRVSVITCDGEKHVVYIKKGEDLATADFPLMTFIPGSCDDWRTEEVDISQFTGQNVVIEFENIGADPGAGNMVYLDNIDISSPQIPNIAPFVLIEDPDDGAMFTLEEDNLLTISAVAGDPDGFVEAVTFFVNGDSVDTDITIPFNTTYTVPTDGDYELIARATDDDGAVAFSDAVMVTMSLFVSTNELEGNTLFDYTLYPNPAKDLLVLSFRASKQKDLRLKIFDPLGKEVLQGSVQVISGTNNLEIQTGHLPSGSYYLTLFGDDAISTRKFVIMK